MKPGDITWATLYRRIREAAFADMPGPHADDAAAASAGVPRLSPYYQADGSLHLNLTAPVSFTFLRPGGADGYFRPDGTSSFLRS